MSRPMKKNAKEVTTDESSNLIERVEQEAGCRWDDPNNPAAMAIIVGAIGRAMGKHNFEERDDFAVGVLIMDEIQNGEKKAAADKMLLALLQAGLSPDNITGLLK